MKIGKQLNRPSMDRITENLLSPSTLFNPLSENSMLEKTVVKAKAKSKKELIREIVEIDSPLLGGGEFNMNSLERTNIQNLELILRMLRS